MDLSVGFPNKKAAHIALDTARTWLETEGNADKVHACTQSGTEYLIHEFRTA